MNEHVEMLAACCLEEKKCNYMQTNMLAQR